MPVYRLTRYRDLGLIDIQTIRNAIRKDRVRITDHADEEARADRIAVDDVFRSVADGEVIEQYPEDGPYPSCLIYGDSGGPIHSVWAYNETNGWVVLITVYRPDPDRWIDWRTRRN